MAGLLWGKENREAANEDLPRGLRVRRGAAGDEQASFEVMRRAMGYAMVWADHAAMRHHLRQSSGSSFWIAEETPRFHRAKTVAYARSVARDGVWCLTEFFTLPDYQRKGLGGVLLNRCLRDGVEFGADTRLVLASQHPAADSLYIRRAGCFPRLPMMLLTGPADALRVSPEQSAAIAETPFGEPLRPNRGARLRAEPLLLTTETSKAINALDRSIVGYARPEEHGQWAATMGGINGAARLFRRASDGEIVGYAYLGAFGSGPALALDPADQPAMIAHVAERERLRGRAHRENGFLFASERYFAVAGINEIVLRWLLDCGWRITFQYLFMASRSMGRLDRYVCHNPLYVL